MSQTIAQDDIEKFRKHAPAIVAGVWTCDILDALTASLAEAQRLREQNVSMEAEIRILRDELARRDAVRVEVPEMTYEAFAEIMDSTESLLGIRQRETVRRERITAWFRARLVPAPPQAAIQVAHIGDSVGHEVAADGTETWVRRTGGNIVSVESYRPHPPQADAVVVPREEWQATVAMAKAFVTEPSRTAPNHAWEEWNRLLESRPAYERLRALRTSAQDHNDNETRG